MPPPPTISRAVMAMTLREELEQRVGTLDDGMYQRLLDMALDDLRQYHRLTKAQTVALLHTGRYPPNDKAHEELAQARERLLDAMVMLWDILHRRGIMGGPSVHTTAQHETGTGHRPGDAV